MSDILFSDFVFKCDILVSKIQVSEWAYTILVSKRIDNMDSYKSLIAWNSQLDIDYTSENWSNIFSRIYIDCLCPKLRYFQYKLLHRVLHTNEMLYKWKCLDNDLFLFLLKSGS